MSKQTTKEQLPAENIINAEVIHDDSLTGAEVFFNKNRNLIYGVLAAVVLAVAGYFGYNYWKTEQNKVAAAEMFQAEFYLQADSLEKALMGDGNHLGFSDIAEEYSGTDAGELANFYAGAIAMKQGKYDEAIDYLEDYNADDLLLQAGAYSLTGDAYMEKGDFSAAAKAYKKAAKHEPNAEFTPYYLMKLGLALEKSDDLEGAVDAYDQVITEYPSSTVFNDARKYKALIETKLAYK